MRPPVGPGIDVIAWNLAEGEREAYQAAFQRARAAAAVEQAFEESETAALDTSFLDGKQNVSKGPYLQ